MFKKTNSLCCLTDIVAIASRMISSFFLGPTTYCSSRYNFEYSCLGIILPMTFVAFHVLKRKIIYLLGYLLNSCAQAVFGHKYSHTIWDINLTWVLSVMPKAIHYIIIDLLYCLKAIKLFPVRNKKEKRETSDYYHQ